jgi:hypothetical protein
LSILADLALASLRGSSFDQIPFSHWLPTQAQGIRACVTIVARPA